MVNKKEVKELSVIAFIILLNVIMGLWGLTVEGGLGIDAYRQKVSFYVLPLIISFAFFIFVLIKLFVPNHPFFKEWHVHDPEESILSKSLSSRFFNTVPKMLLASIIIFSSLAFLIVLVYSLTLTQTGFVEQQITNTGKLIFSAYPVADSETLTIISVFYLMMGIIAVNTSKKNKDLKTGLTFLAIVMIGFLWATFHSQVYGNDEASLTLTFLFGFTGIGITYLTRSIIPFIIWHQVHNLFAKSRELFSDQSILIALVILLALVIFLYVRLVRGRK